MIIDKKIVTLGERASGKTCLIYRYVEGQFQFTRETSGCNYSFKTVETNQYEVRLKFYDTAGQEIYYSIARVYFKGCDAVTLVYRKDSKESFEGLSFWINKVRDFLTEHIPVYLVCTHCDINQGDLIPSELG